MPQAALKEIVEGAGFTPGQEVEINGDDPVLPVRYRIAAAASASLGALGLAVARLSGKPQRVSINARAAAVSLRSARYLPTYVVGLHEVPWPYNAWYNRRK